MSTLSNIIEQGEEVKYKVTISHQGFNMNQNDFQIRLKYGMLGKSLLITKDEMISNSRDEWYFMFSTDEMVGRIKAECTLFIPDTDYADGFRTEVDLQTLCTVITHPLPARICIPSGEGDGVVTYERTEESDVAELYAYLTAANGARLLTADGEYLMALKRR